MTQPSRTTESINRDNAAIREIMHAIRDLTVPDRATLAVGLIGHLATMMNRSQMAKLMAELAEEAERVQDVPPARARDQQERTGGETERAAGGNARAAGAGERAGTVEEPRTGSEPHTAGRGGADSGDVPRPATGPAGDERDGGRYRAVGQGGRGEFKSRDLI